VILALVGLTATVGSAGEGDLVFFSFDDHSIPWRDNLKLTLERPVKYQGNPVLGPGPAGSPDNYGCLMYGTVLKMGDRFRMWHIAWPQADNRIPGDIEAMRFQR